MDLNYAKFVAGINVTRRTSTASDITFTSESDVVMQRRIRATVQQSTMLLVKTNCPNVHRHN